MNTGMAAPSTGVPLPAMRNDGTNLLSRSDLIKKLRALSQEMTDVGCAMDYFGGLDPTMQEHGRELVGAAGCIRNWIYEMTEAESDES